MLVAFLLGLILDDNIENTIKSFGVPLSISLIFGFFLFNRTKSQVNSRHVRDREAFVAVALAWPAVVLIGALPYWLGGMFWGPFNDAPGVLELIRGFINSWFESMSGFTTTGATVISERSSPICMGEVVAFDCINAQSKGLLLWRSLTQWLGGMGIIMLGMLILSRLLGGGMNIARAELTGPTYSRIRPRIQETALVLWGIYITFTVLEGLILFGLGFLPNIDMDLFDAVNHALTTMPSGGFGTHDASIGYYDSVLVEGVITFFMFLTGINFTLIYFAMIRDWEKLWSDEEFKLYGFVMIIASSIMALSLVFTSKIGVGDAFRKTIFQAVSIGTSTGYSSADFAAWPAFATLILLFLMVVGASAGSTSGGLKMLRLNLAIKAGMRELSRIFNPHQIKKIRHNGETISDERLWNIFGVLILWVLLFMGSCLIVALLERGGNFDMETIISVVAASLGNTGPALGTFGPTNTWAEMHFGTLIMTSILMWMGRLELLTVLILIHPRTWSDEKTGEFTLFKKVRNGVTDILNKFRR
jgi:trk system potassium uptake protein TrkH